MKWMLFALVLSTAATLGDESLEQRLTKRDLSFSRPPEGQPLTQALNRLSAEYTARYLEPLPIFIAVDLVQPVKPKPSEPARPIPAVPGLVPPDPDLVRRLPVTEILRYVTDLARLTFSIRDDVVLILPQPSDRKSGAR